MPELTNEDVREGLHDGVALCLSGGGYRAMLFHLGAIMRLADAGWLPRLDRISSVSGGSIVAAWLGVKWSSLTFDSSGRATNFRELVEQPVRHLASKTIDVPSIIRGVLLPGTITSRVVAAYQKHLFGTATLQDLPDHPHFVINATNVQSGVLVRFSKPFIWDYRVGKIETPRRPVAEAVVASSAFPPVLSPVRLDMSREAFVPGSGDDLQRPPFTRTMVLTDGGVYDNLGLETAWKAFETVLVSDAGAKIAPDPDPRADWGRHGLRINSIVDNQVRSLRKRQLIDSFRSGDRRGTYWGARSDISRYEKRSAILPAPFERTLALAETPTRLRAMPDTLQQQLINWGYAICDAAMRTHVDPNFPEPATFPYPDEAL